MYIWRVIVNVIGALYLMAYAVKYMYAFHKAKNQPVRTDAMKPEWAKKAHYRHRTDNLRWCNRHHRMLYLITRTITGRIVIDTAGF